MTSPEPVISLIWAYWKTKVLLSAVRLGVFTELADGPLVEESLRERIGLHPRGTRDFLDCLVAVGLLQREDGRYANNPVARAYLDSGQPDAYLGSSLTALDQQLSGLSDDLVMALRTGQPRTGAHTGEDVFAALYSEPSAVRAFQRGMTAMSMGATLALAEIFPWHEYHTMADIGCAEGALAAHVLGRHPHLVGTGFDLPALREGVEEYAAKLCVADRLRFQGGDFFRDRLPEAEVLVFGHILHNWNLDEKRLLIDKAYQALPPGGALVIYESLIDNERRRDAVGFFMSLTMLIETPGGFDFTGADCQRWLGEAGFAETYVRHLDGPESMVVGIK